jgi:hypothetical protein
MTSRISSYKSFHQNNHILENQASQINLMQAKTNAQKNQGIQNAQRYKQTIQANQANFVNQNKRNTFNSQLLSQNNQLQAQKKNVDLVHEIEHQNQKNQALSKFISAHGLTAAQKRALYRLIAGVSEYLKLVESPEYEPDIEPQDHFHFQSLRHDPLLSTISIPFQNLLTKDDLVMLLRLSRINVKGQEEEFVDELLEICLPEPTEKERYAKFSVSVRRFFFEFEIDDHFELFEKIRVMLHQIASGGPMLSDEQKKKLLDLLKESEEELSLPDMKFDYAAIPAI